MQRNGYREGKKQVNVVVSRALHGQMLRLSGEGSLQAWMVEAFREKVARDGTSVEHGAERGPVGSAEPAGEWERLVAGTGSVAGGGGPADDAGSKRTALSLEEAIERALRPEPLMPVWGKGFFDHEPFEESA